MKTLNATKNIECNLYFLPAGNGDCVLIQYQDTNFTYHNILIDGGNRNQLEFNKQKKKLLEILDNGRKGRLDLVIITHSDDDHIKGILKLVEDEQLASYVNKFWFNSEKTISEFLSSPFQHTQPYLVSKQGKGVKRSSRNQDNDLYHELAKDSKWDCEVILSQRKEMIGSLTITVLSPTIEKLRELNEFWPKMPLNKNNLSRSSTCIPDHNKTLTELYKKLEHFEEDKSPVNGSSIALMLEWGSKRWLLLSDSHPSVVIESLMEHLSDGEEKINFDVVKISHHGSRNNTSDDLLGIIDCNHFVITTNGAKHCHPHKECLARIIKKFTPDETKIYFNYDNKVMRRVFKSNEFENVNFPEENEEGIRFTYES